jgi:hypothetical protein
MNSALKIFHDNFISSLVVDQSSMWLSGVPLELTLLRGGESLLRK